MIAEGSTEMESRRLGENQVSHGVWVVVCVEWFNHFNNYRLIISTECLCIKQAYANKYKACFLSIYIKVGVIK